MLDLNKLEREFDEALAKETPETLDLWLASERALEQISPENFIGHSFDNPISYNEVPSLTTRAMLGMGVDFLVRVPHFGFDSYNNMNAHWCTPINSLNTLTDFGSIESGLGASFLLPAMPLLPVQKEEENCNFSLAA